MASRTQKRIRKATAAGNTWKGLVKKDLVTEVALGAGTDYRSYNTAKAKRAYIGKLEKLKASHADTVQNKVGLYEDWSGLIHEPKSKKLKKAVREGFKGYW